MLHLALLISYAFHALNKEENKKFFYKIKGDLMMTFHIPPLKKQRNKEKWHYPPQA